MAALSHAQARSIVQQAWQQVWNRLPTERELEYAQAVAFLETGYGRIGQFATMAANGQYNWGALERAQNADGSCPAGTAPGADQGNVCFYVFASDVAAAGAFIHTLTQTHWPGVVDAMKGTPVDVATAMHQSPPYFVGTSGSAQDRINVYATAIGNTMKAAGYQVPTSRESGGASLAVVGLLGLAAGYAYVHYFGVPKWWNPHT